MDGKRWSIALAIIAAIIIASVAIAIGFRDTPGLKSVTAVGDASGDTIVCWQDHEGVFVQRINLSGQLLWVENGRLVTAFPPEMRYILTSDGAGGAIFTWYEESGNIHHDDPEFFNPVTFYAQRLNSDGELMWGNGALIGNSNRIGIRFPDVITDGSGGAIFAWNDYKAFHRALHDDILRVIDNFL